VTIAVHWTTVLLIAGLFATALAHDQAPDPASANLILTTHRSLGVAVWGLSLARLLWRLTGARFPPFPARMPKIQQWAAKLSEYALYLCLILQPATGVAQSLYRGKPFALFAWQVPVLLARDKALAKALHEIHEWGGWIMAGIIGLHAAAGLFHALVLRDGVFESMAPIGRRRR
jgi:cytochrome b561